MSDSTKRQLYQRINESLCLGLGQASMAWSETPNGRFLDNQCTEIAGKIMQKVEMEFERYLGDFEESLKD